MSTDLSGLEQAAAELGFPGLRARLVDVDRRRGGWFRWTADELLVSERVVERLRPAEGRALLVHAVIEARHRRRLRERWLGLLALVALVTWAALTLWPSAAVAVTAVALVLLAGAYAVLRGQALVAADDEAVLSLGDPELLVRSINTIQQDELHLGPWRGSSRPDLHRRAERLVILHQLRLAPERRTVPVIGACKGAVTKADIEGRVRRG